MRERGMVYRKRENQITRDAAAVWIESKEKKKNPRFNNNKQKYFIVIKYLFIVLCKDENERKRELFVLYFIIYKEGAFC